MSSFQPSSNVFDAEQATLGEPVLLSAFSSDENGDKHYAVHAACVPICLFQEAFRPNFSCLLNIL